MITLLVGHRGTGKSSLLKRVSLYYRQANLSVQTYDLDKYIEKQTGRSIDQIFTEYGEEYFRNQESKALRELVENLSGEGDAIIAAGAGFNGDIPDSVHVLWVIRPTDAWGRVFLDRPRLNRLQSPLDEYLERYTARQITYRQQCHQVLTLSEGFDFPNDAEGAFFLGKVEVPNASLTVLEDQITSEKRWNTFLKQKHLWNLRFFELRDDLLSSDQLRMAIGTLSCEKSLLSFRDRDKTAVTKDWLNQVKAADWALELGEVPDYFTSWQGLRIVSLHERLEGESVEQALLRLESQGGDCFLKAAPIINSLEELWAGHQWLQKSPKTRCFLPRSDGSRWAWYRLLMKEKMLLNFIREGEGSSQDQPALLDWLRHQSEWTAFAAILGDPVDHSRTPGYHFSYFNQYQMNTLRIPLAREQVNKQSLNILLNLGLGAAAVTSPLKEVAFQVCDRPSDVAREFGALNTLVWNKKEKLWYGHNTDFDGLKYLCKDIPGTQGIIWGGGGTLPALTKLLPEAKLYSARTGRPRSGEDEEFALSPDWVVWATGRIDGAPMPPKNWQPKWVIDLSYSENSMGIEYAVIVGAKYRSGIAMFNEQAKQQQKFWSQYGSK